MTPQQAGVSAEQMREQFESWWWARHPDYTSELLKRTSKSGAYDSDWVNGMWLAWKAALATAPPEQAPTNWGTLPPPLDLREWLKAYRIELTEKQLDVITGFIIMNCLPVQPPEPPGYPCDQPQAVSAGALSAGTWAIETMQIINKLTPDIKDKAFDPDWFLLRQRLEEFESRLAAHDQKVVKG